MAAFITARFIGPIIIRTNHVFADADVLLRRHSPDFLLIHPMNIDNEGHRHGGSSRGISQYSP